MATTERPAATTSIVLDLGELRAGDLPKVGGKAANLGELIAAGLPVPGGFCVTTDAYAEVATGVDTDAPPERVRDALRAAPVPDGVAAAVRAAYRGLGDDVPVAVRSSATAEDLPTASFAGQQDTYLNVVGAEAVLDAVRRCWASLWTDRAVAYRREAGVAPAGVRLAVVVQRMVDAQVAGVLFTADPVSGRRSRAVVDASPGLGEAVVSGAVNPDHLAVENDQVVERRLGERTVAVRALPGGGTEREDLDPSIGVEGCLTDAQAIALVGLGRRAEEHFGTSQDVEWALDATGELWLTQARPITTLYPLLPSRDGTLRAYFCATLAQGLTRPITPMGLSGFRVMGSAAAQLFGIPVPDPTVGPPAYVDAGARAFVDVTAVLRSPIGRAVALYALSIMEARTAVVIRELVDEPEFAVPQGARRRTLRRILPTVVRLRVPLLVAQAVLSPAAARRRVARLGALAYAVTTAPEGTTGTERLDRATETMSKAFPAVPRVGPVFAAGFMMLALARRLAGDDLDDATVDEVLRALPYNVTTEMDLQLWTLAVRVRADADAAAALRTREPAALGTLFRTGTLPPVLQDGLADFLRRYGHRAVAEIDLGMPRWSDDPAHVLGALANYLRIDPDTGQAPDVRFAAGARAAERAVADVLGRVRRRSWWRARAVTFALRRVRQLVGMRETHKDHLVRYIATARAEIAAVGVELADRGLLDDAADVFFLDLPQARAALGGVDLRDVVAARRAEYDRELRRRHVPRILLTDGTEPEAVALPGAASGMPADGALRGTPASAGTVTGPARVVLDPVGAHLEPGEVLVAPSTDPGWTPLFLTAGALVMEMGGANSHGAVVAREYGIPAVVGVPGATTQITTGEAVTVDGAAGLVHR
jgi:rifampicin phosphotransferase